MIAISDIADAAQQQRYDVIIIGSGAGGGTLSYVLANAGKRILILERGGFVAREKDNWNTRAVFLDKKYKPIENWWQDCSTFPAPVHYNVGGNTKFFGATLIRFRKEDFSALYHSGGISPAWPITYDELEPYYTAAEYLYQVHGERGVDPSEPPASKPYLFPAVSHELRIQQLHEDLRKAGMNPFSLPLGILLDEKQSHESRCIRCNTCGGYPCLLQAKADAETVAIRPILNYPNVTLLTNALVQKLNTNTSGSEIISVETEINGKIYEFRSDITVVACGAVNSATLLLRSSNDLHPHGLANSSGQVGRNLMLHNISAFAAISRIPNPTIFQKTLGINDYYLSDAKKWNYPLGNIQLLNKPDIHILSAEELSNGASLSHLSTHGIDFCLTSEDLPDPSNKVMIAHDGKPLIYYSGNNREGHERLIIKLATLLPHIGCEDKLQPVSIYTGQKNFPYSFNHHCGTLRFGHDPSSSVLNAECRAHDIDNLYVVDSSIFPSSTALNPSLTIMANAMRVANIINKKLS